MANEFTEIERKFLLDGFPTDLPLKVEFPSIEAAENFKLLPCLTADVTSDPSYKMKNFWKRTRC